MQQIRKVMKYLTNYKSNVEGEYFTFVDLQKYGLNRKELFSSMNPFVKFMQDFHCNVDEFCKLSEKLAILDKDFFDYSAYKCKDGILVAKDGVSVTRTIKEGYSYKVVETKYDVYVIDNAYANLSLDRIAMELLKLQFPFLTEATFMQRKKRFNDDINKLPESPDTLVKDLDGFILSDNKVTIRDLIDIYTDPGYKDSYNEVPNWRIYTGYSENTVYFKINNDISLYVPLKALYEGNWALVEEKIVHNMPLYDENGDMIKGKFFNGKQKDAPYFNAYIVDKLKMNI